MTPSVAEGRTEPKDIQSNVNSLNKKTYRTSKVQKFCVVLVYFSISAIFRTSRLKPTCDAANDNVKLSSRVTFRSEGNRPDLNFRDNHSKTQDTGGVLSSAQNVTWCQVTLQVRVQVLSSQHLKLRQRIVTDCVQAGLLAENMLIEKAQRTLTIC